MGRQHNFRDFLTPPPCQSPPNNSTFKSCCLPHVRMTYANALQSIYRVACDAAHACLPLLRRRREL